MRVLVVALVALVAISCTSEPQSEPAPGPTPTTATEPAPGPTPTTATEPAPGPTPTTATATATEPAPATATPTPERAAPAIEQSPVPTEPASSVIVSNAVPTMQALQDLGLSQEAAACFIATIDPNNTGIVESDLLFVQAFAECM